MANMVAVAFQAGTGHILADGVENRRLRSVGAEDPVERVFLGRLTVTGHNRGRAGQGKARGGVVRRANPQVHLHVRLGHEG